MDEKNLINADLDKVLSEWAAKVYYAEEKTYKELIALINFPAKEEVKKFLNEMCGKKFGEFVSVFQSKGGLLYLKISSYEVGSNYHPSYYHVEEIKKVLSEYGEKGADVAQEILAQIEAIPAIARTIRRNILYPEITEMENELNKCKEGLKKIVLMAQGWVRGGNDICAELQKSHFLSKHLRIKPSCKRLAKIFAEINREMITLKTLYPM